MAQKLLVFQSRWAMERRRPDGAEWSLSEKLAMIHDAGFDGAGVRFVDTDYAREVTSFLRVHGMSWQAQCYPRSVEELKPVLALVRELGADQVNLQADVRPYRLAECIPYIEGWRWLAPDAGVAVHVETRRDRMTTDLYFTLHLLDCFPDLRLTADLSHYVVGREFAWPIAPEDHAMIHRVLDNSWGLHGRVASREHIQVQLGFPQHRDWVELFMGWWEYSIRSWRQRGARRYAHLPVRTRTTLLCDHWRRRLRAIRPLAGGAGNARHDPRAMAADRVGIPLSSA